MQRLAPVGAALTQVLTLPSSFILEIEPCANHSYHLLLLLCMEMLPLCSLYKVPVLYFVAQIFLDLASGR